MDSAWRCCCLCMGCDKWLAPREQSLVYGLRQVAGTARTVPDWSMDKKIEV
ncbi:MAG: hypothetical protein MUC83_19960 [Pirellula sp.]|nr:hypothetical protein [Pirellula sp.]